MATKTQHDPYPWSKWFSASETRLHKGVHYPCQTHSMVAQIRTAARARRKKVSVEVFNDTIKMTVRNKSAPRVNAKRKK